MFSSVFSFNFCDKFSWTKKFVSFQKFASSDKSERPAHQPGEFGLLLFVFVFFYCAAAARRERFTQLRRPVIIFNAEEQEHDKFIKSTSFDETFTPPRIEQDNRPRFSSSSTFVIFLLLLNIEITFE